MIIQDQQSKKHRGVARWLGLSLILLLGLLAIFYLLPIGANPTISDDLIFCDAERVNAKNFVTGPYTFERGHLQSDEFAHSGQYSCKLDKGPESQYGFSYTLENPEPGTAYKATVWRKKNFFNRGKLVVQAQGEDGFYKQVEQIINASPDDWEMLELSFFIPFNKKIEALRIYVYSDGTQVVYFDDLTIERINQWEARDFQPQILDLKIGKEALQQLEKKRAQAFKVGILESSDDDWVPAQILKEGNEVMPISIRLKGDWLDHLLGDKWSFRLKTEEAQAWRRMKTFSLHTPSARYFLREWLLHQFLMQEDVLTTRYDFVELRLNGKSLGIYAYEEHFEKQLVESKQRREGPILKISEAGYWAGIKRQLQAHGYLRQSAGYPAMQQENADLEAFKERRLLADSTLNKQLAAAKKLLHQYQEGTGNLSSLFHVDVLARYLAICDVLNAYHGLNWHNQRFYFNPVINRLEPVGFDGYGEKPVQQTSIKGQGALHPDLLQESSLLSIMFSDTAFVAAYTGYLYEYSEKQYIEAFLDRLQSDLQPRLEWLQLEFPDYRLDLQELRRDVAYIHSLILPFEDQSVKTFAKALGDKAVLLQNTHLLPVEVLGFGAGQKHMDQRLEEPQLLPGQAPRLLKARLRRNAKGKIQDFAPLRFQESAAQKEEKIAWMAELQVPNYARYIFYRPLGLDTLFASSISRQPRLDPTVGSNAIFDQARPTSNAIYRIEGDKIIFPKGQHDITADLIFPTGYEIHFEAGLQLNFLNNSSFISKSPVFLFGTEEAPIKIYSSDRTGSGFTVLQSPQRSTLHYVIFEGMNTLRKKDWTLTGAVTFYETDVKIDRTVFRDNPCEDALNTVRSTFEITNCRFFNTAFDAFDSDFCKGEIKQCYFSKIGNDAMDFSGSLATIRSCKVEIAGDKGLSLGEESSAYLFDTSIEACPIALASKDASIAFVNDISMRACTQGFVAFQKKAEYGTSKIIVKDYEAIDLERLYAVSDGCTIQLKDKLISK